MALGTPTDLRTDLLRLRTPTTADTVDAVLALLETYGILDGMTPEDAAEVLGVTAIRVRQLANSGDLDGMRLVSGTRSMLLLSAASVARLAPIPRPVGRPKKLQEER